jgi:hypothetical protein
MGFMREMRRIRTLNEYQQAKKRTEQNKQSDGQPGAEVDSAKVELQPIIVDESGEMH